MPFCLYLPRSNGCSHFVYRALAIGSVHGRKWLRFPRPHRRDQKWDGVYFQPWFEKQTNKQKPMFWGSQRRPQMGGCADRSLCSGSLGMAMLLFRLAHQFQPLLAAVRYPFVPSPIPKTDPRDTSVLPPQLDCGLTTAPGTRPRTWFSFQAGQSRGRFFHRHSENESLVPASLHLPLRHHRRESTPRKGVKENNQKNKNSKGN